MGGNGTVLVIGGTGGIGREVARHYHERGEDVIITGRDLERARGSRRRSVPRGHPGLRPRRTGHDRRGPPGLGAVSRLVLSSIARDKNRSATTRSPTPSTWRR